MICVKEYRIQFLVLLIYNFMLIKLFLNVCEFLLFVMIDKYIFHTIDEYIFNMIVSIIFYLKRYKFIAYCVVYNL